MKLTNTWKHAIVGAGIGLLWFMMCLIPGMWQLEVFGMIAFFLLTVGWENAQIQRHKNYCRENNRIFTWNWLDSAVDIVAANAAFHAVYWLLV